MTIICKHCPIFTCNSYFNLIFCRKEFSLVPTLDDNLKNKSPVLYEECCLGLESWCVKYVYKYAYVDLFKDRDLLRSKKLSLHKMKDLNHLLIGALLINPDVYTFWNMKRELVEQNILDINKELEFSKLVLSHKSKSNEAFAYRKWLLTKQINQKVVIDLSYLENMIIKELEVTNMTAEKAQNNYHSWNHRIWVFNKIKTNFELTRNHMENELRVSLKWVFSHVSEHSGYHYRQFLINSVRDYAYCQDSFDTYYNYVKKYLKSTENTNYVIALREILGPWDLMIQADQLNSSGSKYISCVNYFSILLYEIFYTLESLHKTFPDHESVWYHRKSIIHLLFKAMYELSCLSVKYSRSQDILKYNTKLGQDLTLKYTSLENGEKEPKLFKHETNKVESSLLYKLLLQNEYTFVMNSLSNNSHLTVKYAKQYEKWLKFIVQLYKV